MRKALKKLEKNRPYYPKDPAEEQAIQKSGLGYYENGVWILQPEQADEIRDRLERTPTSSRAEAFRIDGNDKTYRGRVARLYLTRGLGAESWRALETSPGRHALACPIERLAGLGDLSVVVVENLETFLAFEDLALVRCSSEGEQPLPQGILLYRGDPQFGQHLEEGLRQMKGPILAAFDLDPAGLHMALQLEEKFAERFAGLVYPSEQTRKTLYAQAKRLHARYLEQTQVFGAAIEARAQGPARVIWNELRSFQVAVPQESYPANPRALESF